MPREGFAHLHVHSEFSMLDGAARVNDMVAAAAADDQPAIAITDHGVLYGVIDFYKAATEVGIKPIIGMEAYLTPPCRTRRSPICASHSLSSATQPSMRCSSYQSMLTKYQECVIEMSGAFQGACPFGSPATAGESCGRSWYPDFRASLVWSRRG